MKKLALCAVVLLMSFGPSASGDSSAAQPQSSTCRQACEQAQFECYVNAQTKTEQKKCLAEYRRCIAHCR